MASATKPLATIAKPTARRTACVPSARVRAIAAARPGPTVLSVIVIVLVAVLLVAMLVAGARKASAARAAAHLGPLGHDVHSFRSHAEASRVRDDRDRDREERDRAHDREDEAA